MRNNIIDIIVLQRYIFKQHNDMLLLKFPNIILWIIKAFVIKIKTFESIPLFPKSD